MNWYHTDPEMVLPATVPGSPGSRLAPSVVPEAGSTFNTVARQWFRFVHIGFFHVLIGANILLTRPDWFCLLDCHDKHRVLMGEPTICTSLLWVLEILNRHYCLLQRSR